jgi:hypothetical protein
VQTFESRDDELTFTLVDPRKAGLRIASLIVWCGSVFLLYKAAVEAPSEGWVLWGTLGIFAVCCYSVVHEFMLRPMRVTTVFPWRRQIVVQETAPWRKRQKVTSIPPAARFEVFRCDSDNAEGYGVRVRSQDNGWLTIAEYVSEKGRKASPVTRIRDSCSAKSRGAARRRRAGVEDAAPR